MDLGFGTGMSQNLYIEEFSPQNGILRVIFVIFSLRMRRNAHNTTSGFKMDLGFGTGMFKNLHVEKFCPKNVILTRLWLILCCDNAYNGRNRDFTLIFIFSPKIWGRNIFLQF